MFLRRNNMADTARHTLYKTRLTEHAHAELMNSIKHSNTRKTEYGYRKLYDLLSKLTSINNKEIKQGGFQRDNLINQ